jgi:NDP-sugar pyrophosphorylase family protein
VNLKFKVIYGDVVSELSSLDEAMAYAKTLNEFVTIKGESFEVVGRFGVDSVQNGKCPDGIAYDWNKASRIGRVKRERVA